MYLMIFLIVCVITWWLSMTSPKNKDWGGLWDGPESEDEL